MSYISPEDRFVAENFKLLNIHRQFQYAVGKKRLLMERILMSRFPSFSDPYIISGSVIGCVLGIMVMQYLVLGVNYSLVTYMVLVVSTVCSLGLMSWLWNRYSQKRFYKFIDNNLYTFYKDYPEPSFDHKRRIQKVSRWFKPVCMIPIDDGTDEKLWSVLIVSPVGPKLFFAVDIQ